MGEIYRWEKIKMEEPFVIKALVLSVPFIFLNLRATIFLLQEILVTRLISTLRKLALEEDSLTSTILRRPSRPLKNPIITAPIAHLLIN